MPTERFLYLVTRGRTTEAPLLARIRALMQEKYGWSNGLVVEIAPSG
jgi:hypothetical protein